MTTTSKIAIGLSVAGGALIAAWLLTGDRKKKTREFVARTAQDMKLAISKEKTSYDDSEFYYL